MKSSGTLSKYRHRHLLMFLFLVGIIMFVLLKHASGQNLPDSNQYARSYFLNTGIGIGGSGTAIQAEVDFQCSEKNMILFGIDATSGGSLPIFVIKPNTTDAASLYVAYGWVIKTKGTVVTGSVGLASTSLVKYGNVTGQFLFFQTYEVKQSVETSLHVQGQVIFGGSFAGLSITGFANINENYSYAGLTFGVALGKINFMKKK